MTNTLSDMTVHLVKATVPALQEHGLAITKRMYERMFQNEAIRDLFNQSHHGETGSQPKALASASQRRLRSSQTAQSQDVAYLLLRPRSSVRAVVVRNHK